MKKQVKISVSICLMLFIFTPIISAQEPEIVFRGHKRAVTSVAFSPDNRYALSGSEDKTVRLWDVETGQQIHVLKGHAKTVTSVAFSSDGSQILSGGEDKTLRLWNVKKDKQIRVFRGHTKGIRSAVFSPDGRYLLSGSSDQTLRLWDTATGKQVRVFKGHKRVVASVAFSPDGHSIVSGSVDGMLVLWNTETGKQIHSFQQARRRLQRAGPPITSIAFAPDGRYVLTGSVDQILKLWDVETRRIHRTFSGHTGSVFGVAFSPDGRYVLSGSFDKTMRLWEAKTGKQIRAFEGHSNDVTAVAFSADGTQVLSGSTDKTIRLWKIAPDSQMSEPIVKKEETNDSPDIGGDTVELDPVAQIENTDSSSWVEEDNTLQPKLIVQTGHTRAVKSVAFSPDGRYVISGSSDNTLRLWDVKTGMEVRVFAQHTSGVTSVAFSPDGQYVISGSLDKTLRLWDVKTGRQSRVFTGHTGFVTAVAFSPDGRHVVSGGHERDLQYDVSLRLWDIRTGLQIRLFIGHTSRINSVAFSPDGRYIISGSGFRTKVNGLFVESENRLRLWDVATGREIRTFTGHREPINSVAFSPDGYYVVSASGATRPPGDWTPLESTLRLWEVATGKQARVFKGHTSAVIAVAFSPDGQHIISGSEEDKTLRLWEVATGKEIRVFQHAGSPTSVAFGTRGHYVISGSLFGMAVYLWDVTTGKKVRAFTGTMLTGGIQSVALSPDGDYIASGSLGRRLYLWDVKTGRQFRTFKGGHMGPIKSVAFSPNGHFVVSAVSGSTRGHPGFLALWEVNTGKQICVFRGHTEPISSVAFSPDGQYVLSGSAGKLLKATNRTSGGWEISKTVRLWDVETGKEIRAFMGKEDVQSVGFSPDGRYVLSSGANSLRLWDVATGREVRTFPVKDIVQSVAFSPDGRYIISGEGDLILRLWEIQTGKEIRTFKGHIGLTGSSDDRISAVAFSPNGLYAISTGSDYTIRLWEVKTGKQIRVFQGHQGAVWSAIFSPNGRRVFSGGEDGTIRLWNVETGKEVAALIAIDENEYVTALPDNYYQANKDALKEVAFSFNNRVFPFEQFDLKYNRPDIVLERLGKASPETIAAYRRLYQKRLQKMGFTEEMLSSDFHVPEVSILSKDIPISTTTRFLTFRIHATDSKSPLDRINVWINDVPIYGTGGIPLRGNQVQSLERKISVQLSNGENKIQVSALNTRGAESLKETFSITYNGPKEKPDVYLLAIGVSQYQDPPYNLEYAAKDALDLARLYQNEVALSSEFGNVHVQTITDASATRENIQNAQSFFEPSKVDDLAILFVAGHGVVDEALDYYFGTHDMDFSNPKGRGLPYEELDNLLDGIPARQKLFLMDTCFSGEIDETETEIIVASTATNLTIEGQVRARAFIDKRGFKAKQRLSESAVQFQADLFAELRRGTGAVIITSSSGDEYSFESEAWKNGVFTYCMLKGLKEKAADSNRDEKISVSELRDYVIEQVHTLTNGGQNPTARRENLENDFRVY